MIPLTDIATVSGGTPQFRITEDASGTAPSYVFYGQADLEEDLRGSEERHDIKKTIKTFDRVHTASTGDVVFSLLSGVAAIVQPSHDGYLLTQNYAVLVPSDVINTEYLVYLLNEHPLIRHQLHLSQQGSVTMKYTLSQLNGLRLPELSPLDRQRRIGELYVAQLRLESLRKRVSELETTLVLAAIREADLA